MGAGMMPVKTVVVACELSGYEGWSMVVRTNAKMKVLKALEDAGARQDLGGICASLAELVEQWDFVDEDGVALPAPKGNAAAFLELPTEVVRWIVERVLAAVQEAAISPN